MPVSASIEIAAPPEAVRAKVRLSYVLVSRFLRAKGYHLHHQIIPRSHISFPVVPQTCLLTLRTKFLDFSSLPQYHKDFFGSITPLSQDLNPGSKVRVFFNAAGQKMDASIIVRFPLRILSLLSTKAAIIRRILLPASLGKDPFLSSSRALIIFALRTARPYPEVRTLCRKNSSVVHWDF